MPHDDPAPIHWTRRESSASRKLRAEGNLGRICEGRDASGRKSIGKADVCRTEGTQFKPEPGVDTGKQQEKKHDKRQGLKEEFAHCPDRRPHRARGCSTMKLD